MLPELGLGNTGVLFPLLPVLLVPEQLELDLTWKLVLGL